MKKRLLFIMGVGVVMVVLAVALLMGNNIAVLNPQGIVAERQRDLIVFTVLLSMTVIIPVYVLLFIISWKYRAGNKKAKYTPDWDGNKALEALRWGIPLVIIMILGVVTWRTSHELDPSRPLESTVQPITIQVVALQWKWLFIYPKQRVASVNLVQFPEKTPVNFTLTSDAPMNSFWIPSLGSQVYCMSGMSSQLNLMASSVGTYDGRSANISGKGFSKMRFTARSSSEADFKAWVKKIKQTSGALTMERYNKLALPDVQTAPTYYSLEETSLYDTIVMKYMAHGEEGT